MEKKELIVKTKYEELFKTEYGYWIEHIEYEDEAETVKFEGGGCSISNEVVDKLLDRAREDGRKHMQGWECPKCGSVYSPLTFECTSCKNSGIKVRTSDKTSGYDNTSYLN